MEAQIEDQHKRIAVGAANQRTAGTEQEIGDARSFGGTDKGEDAIHNPESIAERESDSARWILDRVTGSDPSVTDYLLEVPAKCPLCRRDILEKMEKTLIEPRTRC